MTYSRKIKTSVLPNTCGARKSKADRQTDREMDDGQSDPYVGLCSDGATKILLHNLPFLEWHTAELFPVFCSTSFGRWILPGSGLYLRTAVQQEPKIHWQTHKTTVHSVTVIFKMVSYFLRWTLLKFFNSIPDNHCQQIVSAVGQIIRAVIKT